jgi:hypothetical protein
MVAGTTSLTEYPRQYTTDLQHYLIVWEGNPGSYDYYGDFEDDTQFYNHVVKGYTAHINIYLADSRRGSLSVGIAHGLKNVYERSYRTLSDMRTGMLAEWADIPLELGQEGKALREFITQNADRTLNLLRKHGQAWVEADANAPRHFLIERVDIHLYLCLWVGAPDAVTASEQFGEGQPMLHWSQIAQYAELRVRFMRIPVRFDLEQRWWKSTLTNVGYYFDLLYSQTRDSPMPLLRSFEDLQAKLDEVMKNLDFVVPGPG